MEDKSVSDCSLPETGEGLELCLAELTPISHTEWTDCSAVLSTGWWGVGERERGGGGGGVLVPTRGGVCLSDTQRVGKAQNDSLPPHSPAKRQKNNGAGF